MSSKNQNYKPPDHLLNIEFHKQIIYKHFKIFINDNIEIEIESVGNNINACSTYKIRVIYINSNDDYEIYICKLMRTNYDFIKDISIQSSDLNISPKVLYYNDEDKFIIYKYIEIMRTKGSSYILRMENLVKKIKLYHSIDCKFTNETINIQYDYKKHDCLNIYNLAFSIYDKLVNYLKEKYGEVLCHNNLHEMNRIWNNGEYNLIDFEASFKSIPLFDLGFQTLYFKNKEIELLTLYYNKEPNQELIDDFYIATQCSFINYALCFKNNFSNLNVEEVTIRFKDILPITKVSYEQIHSLNFYIPNYLYFMIYIFIKEGFSNILNKKSLFTHILDDESLDKINSIL